MSVNFKFVYPLTVNRHRSSGNAPFSGTILGLLDLGCCWLLLAVDFGALTDAYLFKVAILGPPSWR